MNMGKRIVSALLAGILVCAVPGYRDAYADEAVFHQTLLGVECMGGTRYECALHDENGVWYLSADTIDRYSRYAYNSEAGTFSLGSGDFGKVITIDRDAKTAVVRGYEQPLSEIYDWNGSLYLPIHQIFPLMEMVCKVEDGALSLSQAEMTLAEALDGFSMDGVKFDADKEFAGSDIAKYLMIGTAWLYDSVSKLKLDRAVLWTDNPEDYKTIFEEYLGEQDAYKDAIELAEGKGWYVAGAAAEGAATVTKGTFRFIEYMEDFFKWYDEADLNHTMDKIFYSKIGKNVVDNASTYGIYASALGRGLKMYLNYCTMIQDNLDMLKTVYPEIGGTPAASDVKLWTIKNTYDRYKDFDTEAFAKEVAETALWEAGKDLLKTVLLKPTSVFWDAAAAVTAAGVDWCHKQIGIGDSAGLALLDYHLGALEDALDKYEIYRERQMTPDNQESLRLSAIMCLITSKRCFEIMRDNNSLDEEMKSYYNNRINTIKDYLAKLYLAQEGIMADGAEFYQAATDAMGLMFAQLTEQSPRANDTIWWEFFKTNYDIEDAKTRVVMLDLTGDGVDEMAVSQYRDDWSQVDIYMLYEGYPTWIHSEYTAGMEDDILMLYAKDTSGQYGILKVTYDNDVNFWDGVLGKTFDSLAYDFIVFDQAGGHQLKDWMQWSAENGTAETNVVNALERYVENTVAKPEDIGKSLLYLYHNNRENLRGYTNIYSYFGYMEETEPVAFQIPLSQESSLWGAFLQSNFDLERTHYVFKDVTMDDVEDLIVIYQDWTYEGQDIPGYYVDVYTLQDGYPTYLWGEYADTSDGAKARIWLTADTNGRKPGILSERPEWGSDSCYYNFVTMVMGYLDFSDGIYAYESEYHVDDILLLDTFDSFAIMGGSSVSGWLTAVPETYAPNPVPEGEAGTDYGVTPEMQSMLTAGWWEGMFGGEYYSFSMSFEDQPYLYVQKSGDMQMQQVPVVLETGTDIMLTLNDNGMLASILYELSPEVSGGGYSVKYDPESRMIYITTNSGLWIELNYFGQW